MFTTVLYETSISLHQNLKAWLRYGAMFWAWGEREMSCAFITDTLVYFNNIVDKFEEKVSLNITAKLCSYT